LQRLKEVAAEELHADAAHISIVNEQVLVNGEKSGWDWRKLVMAAYVKRVSLSEHAHYATPGLHYDHSKEKGHPFAYHVYGTAIITATVDCLRGIYEIDAVKVVHDNGAGMNPVVDKGQLEGGIVQGIGWMSMEEVVYDQDGRLRSNALSTYKVPDVYSIPKELVIHILHTERDNLAVFRSKAVGEPPLMYGIGAFFALRNAIRAFHPDARVPFHAPMTPEKVLMNLYSSVPVIVPA
jgi:xanthine dehydrogenase large subunit